MRISDWSSDVCSSDLDCYRYASAQTRRDAQFIDDRNAGIDTLTNRSPYSGLRQRVDEYDLRNRRSSLMSSCMESKGYARADNVLPRLEFLLYGPGRQGGGGRDGRPRYRLPDCQWLSDQLETATARDRRCPHV